MSQTVKFGFISRGVVPYIFCFQNVHLKQLNKSDTSHVILNCIISPKNTVNVSKENNIKIFTNEQGTNLIYESNDPNLNFVCNIDPDTYQQTYKVNDKILFQCRYDPIKLDIIYTNMKATITEWNFVDH